MTKTKTQTQTKVRTQTHKIDTERLRCSCGAPMCHVCGGCHGKERGIAHPDQAQARRIVVAVLASANYWDPRECDLQAIAMLAGAAPSEGDLVRATSEYWRDHLMGEWPESQANRVRRRYWMLRMTPRGAGEIAFGRPDDATDANEPYAGSERPN
jgi:hypothetical protein